MKNRKLYIVCFPHLEIVEGKTTLTGLLSVLPEILDIKYRTINQKLRNAKDNEIVKYKGGLFVRTSAN